MTSWATIGYDMVIFLAALQGIPSHLYEAATVDGAGRWQHPVQDRRPADAPTIFFILVTNTITVAADLLRALHHDPGRARPTPP